MELTYRSVDELVEKAEAAGCRISGLVLREQAEQLGKPEEELVAGMRDRLQVMRESIEEGIVPSGRMEGRLAGSNAHKLKAASESGRNIGGRLFSLTLARALAVAENNACMGKIVAAPTAGSCGIVPAVLLTAAEQLGLDEHTTVMGLFTAGAIGMVVANRATIAGAEGGCQAECGSASAMAAAALVEMAGGTPTQAAHACAISLKNVLGLVCDPVAGLVEVPCIKRNAAGAANALAAAEMALAGVESAIPADEVIDAMRSVSRAMPQALRETSEGGLAATPTAKRYAQRLSES